MEHKKEIFADGIGQIHFAGGMVRFDFVTLQPNENGAAPTPVVNERIIMPPAGLPRRVQLDAAAHRQAARSRRPAEERAGQVKAAAPIALLPFRSVPEGLFFCPRISRINNRKIFQQQKDNSSKSIKSNIFSSNSVKNALPRLHFPAGPLH